MVIDRAIISLLALATVGQMASALFLPSLPLIADDLAVSPGRVQLLSPIYLIVYALAHLVGGFLCDVIGRKYIIASGVLFAVLGGLLTAIGTLEALYLGRMLQAMGFGLAAIATKAILRDRYEGRKYAVAISYFLNIALLAPAAAPLIGAWLAQQFGWLAQFAVLAGVTLFMAIPVFLFNRTIIDSKSGSSEKIVDALLPILRDKRCIGLSFLSGIVYAADISIEITMPFLLMDKYGANTKTSALFFAFSLMLILIGTSAIRFIKSDIKILVKYGTVLMLGASLLLLTSDSVFIVISALGLYLLACVMLYSTISAIALFSHKRFAGVAASISGAIHMGIAGLGAAFATWLMPALPSLRLVLFVVAILVFLLNIALVRDANIATEPENI